ncbi:MAG: adenosylmethionine--8-amino-7-oxononanoate transaminase [Bacteroidota bacterium]
MSKDLLQKDKTYVWHPFTQAKTAQEPLLIESAKGAKLFSSDGKSYIDANSSWWVNVHGHGNVRIGEAISKQFQKIDHVIFADATHETAVNLAEEVVTLLGNPFSKVFFSDNGSTAVEVALKMAIQFWQNRGETRHRIVALEGAYHGDTFGAMSVGQRGYFNKPFEQYFFEVDFLDFPIRDKEEEILRKAKQLFATNEVAVLIIEPLILGSAGMLMYSVDFLENLCALAKKYDVLIIFDEVMTAWGRTGKLFAFEHTTVRPDIICLSKGLTGGVLPLGLTVATEEIFEAFLYDEKAKALLHGHSFTGNALSCAAALASIELFKETATWENIGRIIKQHQTFAEQLATISSVKNIRQLGTIIAFEVEIQGQTEGYFASIKEEIVKHMLEHGVLLRPLGNTVFLNPPYCVSDEELGQVYTAILGFFES